jgi:hypothetical protein
MNIMESNKRKCGFVDCKKGKEAKIIVQFYLGF